MKRCLIFDIDGTLVDSLGDIAEALNLLRKRFDLPPQDRELIRTFIGNGAKVLVERSFAGEDKEKIAQAVLQMNECYHEASGHHSVLYPGVREGLTQFREQGFVLAVSSNKPEAACRELLKNLQAESFFDRIAGGCAEIPLKPAPDSLLKVMKETDSLPENSWMLGDNWTDLEAARRAGIRGVFAQWGYGSPGKETPYAAIPDFPSFCRIVKQMQH